LGSLQFSNSNGSGGGILFHQFSGSDLNVGSITPSGGTSLLFALNHSYGSSVGSFNFVDSASNTIVKVQNNGNVGIGTTAPGKLLSVGANLWQADVNGIEWNNGAQTTVNGLTGTAVWSQPFQGGSYKKFLVYLTGFTSAGTVITFPTAFSKAPVVYGDAAAIAIAVTTTTTTTLTSVGAVAGFIIIEGY
jgi:hypothetical protein